MRKILSIRHTGEHVVTLRIEADGKSSSYSVSQVTYASLGSPPSGYSLSEEELSLIESEDEAHRALKRALTILSYSDSSESSLRMKLRRAGFSAPSSEEAVRQCVMRGYLNEDRQLERAIRKEAEAEHGPYYIRRKLVSRGYSPSSVSKAMTELTSSGEIDFKEIFEALSERLGAEGEERRALAYKRGFKA